MGDKPIRRFAALRNWFNLLTETQRDAVRFSVWVVVLAVLGAAGYFGLQPAWRKYRHQQALSQAEKFSASRDYRDMLLALRRATDLAPNDVATWQIVARRLGEIGSPEALVARQNAAHLAPQDVSLRLALVGEALRFGDSGLAREALAGIDAAAGRDAAFHRLAAAVALAEGRDADLESALARLVPLAPADPAPRFNLAAVRIWNTDTTISSAALAELEALAAVPAVRVRASLELLKHAARRGDTARAQAVVALLLPQLLPAGVSTVPVGDPPGWAQLLEGLKSAASDSPPDVVLVARWLADVRLRREALVWLDTLPPEVREAPSVLDVAAELSAELGDTARVDRLLRAGAWGPLPGDALTLALAARVQTQRDRLDRARETWHDAISVSAGSASGLRALSRLALAWGDGPGAERALQMLIERWPKTWWAYSTLRTRYAARADTAALWQLLDAWQRAQPDDPKLVSEWLLLGAVLDRHTPAMLARATDLYTSRPHDPEAAAACAAALWRAKRPGDAVRILDTLPPALRSRADIALWDALAMADLGRKSEAFEALKRAYRPDLPDPYLQLCKAAAGKIGATIVR